MKEKILQIREQLDSGVSSPDHGNRKQLLLLGGIGRMVRVLAQIQDVLAQHHGVLQRPEFVRVLSRARSLEIVRPAAQRDDQRIVFDRPRGGLDAAGVNVDRVDGAPQKAEPPAAPYVANRLRDVARVNVARSNQREQRSDQDEILLANQQDFVVRRFTEQAFQFHHRLHPCESRPENDDALHRCPDYRTSAPLPCLPPTFGSYSEKFGIRPFEAHHLASPSSHACSECDSGGAAPERLTIMFAACFAFFRNSPFFTDFVTCPEDSFGTGFRPVLFSAPRPVSFSSYHLLPFLDEHSLQPVFLLPHRKFALVIWDPFFSSFQSPASSL